MSKDLLICGVCKASFSLLSFTQFLEHKMLHIDDNKSVVCCLCLQVLPDIESLQNHIEQVHAIPRRTSCSGSQDCQEVTNDSNTNSDECKPCSCSSDGDKSFSFGCENLEICRPNHNNSNSNNSSSPEMSLSNLNQAVSDFLSKDCNSIKHSYSSVDILSTENFENEVNMNSSLLSNHSPISTHGFISEKDIAITTTTPESDTEAAVDMALSSVTDNFYKSNSAYLEYNCEDISAEAKYQHSVNSNGDNMNYVLTAEDGVESPITHGEASSKVDEERAIPKATSQVDNNQATSPVDNNVDFHFLLGTTNIKGNSMSYERVEFKCMHCSFSSAWRPSLIKHMKTVHSDVLALHEVLDIQNVKEGPHSESDLSKKYKILKLSDHTNMTKAQKNSKRNRPVEAQDIPGKYTCPVCNKVFSRVRYIRRHQMTHRTQRAYICDSCGKSFKTKATLATHSRSHKVKIYQCPQCDFVSSLNTEIHHHRQLHPNGSVMCEVCGAAYNDKSTLKKHSRVHDLGRPFPCPHLGCTWRFKSETLMKSHEKSHTVEGKFQCPSCLYRFRHKHHLQRHIARIHPLDNSTTSMTLPTTLSTPEDKPTHASESETATSSVVHSLPTIYDVSLNCDTLNSDILKSVFDSKGMLSLPSRTLSPYEQMDGHEENGESSPAPPNIMQVVVNDRHEIVINIQSENDLDFSGSVAINLDCNNGDLVKRTSSDQMYSLEEDPHNN